LNHESTKYRKHEREGKVETQSAYLWSSFVISIFRDSIGVVLLCEDFAGISMQRSGISGHDGVNWARQRWRRVKIVKVGLMRTVGIADKQ
jgi:hypothetical protein